MKLEDQVCSLELAKKLKDLGVPQGRTQFVWFKEKTNECDHYELGIVLVRDNWKWIYPVDEGSWFKYDSCDCIDAPNVAELGEMLPYWVENKAINLPCKSNKNVNGEGVEIEWFWYTKEASGYVNTEANARTKMRIYLIENGLIKVEDL